MPEKSSEGGPLFVIQLFNEKFIVDEEFTRQAAGFNQDTCASQEALPRFVARLQEVKDILNSAEDLTQLLAVR